MTATGRFTLATLCGVTGAVAMLAVTWLWRTHFQTDPFTYNFIQMVPIGAFATGALAALGFGAAFYLDVRPRLTLLFAILLTLFVAHSMMYVMGYQINGDHGYGFVSYVQHLIEGERFQVGHNRRETAAIGVHGYGLAVARLLAFFTGGVTLFGYLSTRRICPVCFGYFRSGANIVRHFADENLLQAYYAASFDRPVIPGDKPAGISEKNAPLRLAEVAMHCPQKHRRTIRQTVTKGGGKHRQTLTAYTRYIDIPVVR